MARLWDILFATDLAALAEGSEGAAGLSTAEADLMGGWGEIWGDMAFGDLGEPERRRIWVVKADRGCWGEVPNAGIDVVLARAVAAISYLRSSLRSGSMQSDWGLLRRLMMNTRRGKGITRA
jgi:hypothetical protein